jgi:hypothetical protein
MVVVGFVDKNMVVVMYVKDDEQYDKRNSHYKRQRDTCRTGGPPPSPCMHCPLVLQEHVTYTMSQEGGASHATAWMIVCERTLCCSIQDKV